MMRAEDDIQVPGSGRRSVRAEAHSPLLFCPVSKFHDDRGDTFPWVATISGQVLKGRLALPKFFRNILINPGTGIGELSSHTTHINSYTYSILYSKMLN